MKKLIPALSIVLLLISIFGSWHSAQASASTWRVLPASQIKVDPLVLQRLNQLQAGETVTVILTLKQQADLSKVNGADRAERQQGVIRALQATADGTQVRLKGLLTSYQAQGLVSSFTSFWVFNGFSVTATREVIEVLIQDPDVLTITPDEIQVSPTVGTPEPNITLVNAPALWSQGYSGQGVVVASMDSGVDVTHPDLASRWRGGSNSWFDPYNQHSMPVDLSGHGTWTTGIMVGGDAGGTNIGVAPGAQWIAVKIFNDQGGSTSTAIHLGFQWLLDPDRNPNTADAPQVVNNSWTFANPGCNLEFEADMQSLRAAGILPVFAAGNGGPSGNTSYSPSNNPSAFAVGAIDNNNQIYTYSSRGPNTCVGSTGPFPELVAPGVNIRTTGLYGTYYTDSGTSFAAPHVAGGLALLLSAYPNLDAGMQEQALINTAVDLGVSGPDDMFGYGRLNLLSALNWAATAPTSTPAPTTTPLPSSTPIPSATPLSNVNLALNRPVTVSSYQDSAHSGSMAVDGDSATFWQTQRITGKNKLSSEWITVDLGSNQNISQVMLAWDAYFATGYTIQVSSNNSSWSTVISVSNGDGGVDPITFNTVQARYVRLNTYSWNNSTNHNWLKEFEVYAGATSSPSPTSPPAPTSTPLPTSTPVTGGSIHAGNLDAAATRSGSRWNAIVYMTVHDASEMPIPGVTVSGSWSNGTTGSGSCTTGTDGTCNISRNNLKTNVGSVNFSVSNLAFTLPYQQSANHDPDGDSNGSSIIVLRP